MGGFHDGGDGDNVYLYPEYGAFASMLLDAAETRPKTVKEVNMKRILEVYPDLVAVDKEKALVSLYDGSWDEKAFALSKRYPIPLDGVLTGRWVGLLSPQDSFVKKSASQNAVLSLFPGVWYYLNTSRGLMLTIIVTDKGEYWVKLSEKPKWY
ncbi:MAG: hypothetical protein KBS81_08225 [Spirochaetales bacterium]|nr:hypothetical protein [Candidatus Physcosoma equi]